jgi:transcriptional regulator with GAF, ATPase, and Fis domain
MTNRETYRTLISHVVNHQPGLRAVFTDMDRLHGFNISVLVQGESGTGKEVIARALHECDPTRCGGPFVAINCAALPEQLLEADLFGYRRGAFTGAQEDRQGLFAQADQGTLFLDEVGELPLSLQAKLLRVLQERTVRPLGAREEMQVDVQVVSATNRDLAGCVQEQLFRQDLYFRLGEYVIEVPPLRRRRQDIVPLAHYFAQQYGSELQRCPAQFTREAERWLHARDWSANNVRELSLCVKRAMLRCDDGLLGVPELVQSELGSAAAFILSPKPKRSDLGEQQLRETLERTEGNISAAARLLGMKRSTLFDRLTRLGLRKVV